MVCQLRGLVKTIIQYLFKYLMSVASHSSNRHLLKVRNQLSVDATLYANTYFTDLSSVCADVILDDLGA